MDIMTTKEAAKKWGVTERRVCELIRSGRIDGVFKVGANYAMPADAQKPADARITHGKYIGKYSERNKSNIKRKEDAE